MSDDLDKKIKQITDILGQENMPENVKGLLSLLAGSGDKKETEDLKHSEIHPSKDERPYKSDLEDNIELIRKAKKVMDKMKSNNDPRINLLTAIRPFLNNTRQKKLGNCIMLLQMTSLTKYMDENDKSFF